MKSVNKGLDLWPVSKIKISEIKLNKRNPRQISKDKFTKLKDSLNGLGVFKPIILKHDNELLGGSQRIRAILEELPSDFEIYASRPPREMSDKEYDQVLLMDNTHFGEWDVDILANEFDIDDLKFADVDIDIPEVEVLPPSEQDDEVPEIKHDPITKRGDVWLLGDHRLKCGDSTMIDDVEDLMNGEKADMVFTDPPYGMKLNADYSDMDSKFEGSSGGNKYQDVIGDHEDFNDDFINNIFGIFGYCKEIFLWGADYYSDLLDDKNSGSWIVWDKRANGNDDIDKDESSDKMYGSCFELCWSKTKHKRDIARIKWAGIFGLETQDTKKRCHPTQKPIELTEWFFNRWGKGLSNIVDLFLGSGSTLIACEKTNRKCYGMELSEMYTDTIINRWQDFTSKDAILESTGQTYKELMNGESR